MEKTTAVAIDIHSEYDAKDITLCKQINDILQKHYPGHPWMVGCNHKAGTIHIELPYLDRLRTRFPYGYMLHINKMVRPSVVRKKTIHAGGELLERYNLARGKATENSELDAAMHGLDRSNAV